LLLIGSYDDVIHKGTRDLHVLAAEVALSDQTLHLRNSYSAVEMCSGRQGKILSEESFIFHRDVAALVSACAADDCNVDGKGSIQKEFLVVDRNQLNEIIRGPLALLAAAMSRIDERVKPRARQKPRPTGSYIAGELRKSSLRKGVGFDFIRNSQGGESRTVVETAADHPSNKSGIRQFIESSRFPIADRD